MGNQSGLRPGWRASYDVAGGLPPTRLVLVTPGRPSVQPLLMRRPYDHPAGAAVLTTLLGLVAIEGAWFALLYRLVTAL